MRINRVGTPSSLTHGLSKGRDVYRVNEVDSVDPDENDRESQSADQMAIARLNALIHKMEQLEKKTRLRKQLQIMAQEQKEYDHWLGKPADEQEKPSSKNTLQVANDVYKKMSNLS